MTATCPHCKLPTVDAHLVPELCVTALRAELDRSEVWQDNQRLQRELSAKSKALDCAVSELRLVGSLLVSPELQRFADDVVAMAKGER